MDTGKYQCLVTYSQTKVVTIYTYLPNTLPIYDVTQICSLSIFMDLSTSKKRNFQRNDAVTCLLHPLLNKRYCCHKVPTAISKNVAFIVNTISLEHSEDLNSGSCCVVPVSTAQCERGFSTQNHIKSKLETA